MAVGTPSTTGGSGAGTEVLRRASGSITDEQSVLTVGSDKIVTIISLICKNEDGSGSTDLYIKAHNGTADLTWVQESGLAAGKTFVFNEKVVLTAGDVLKIVESGSVTLAYWLSYIEQEF